MTLTQQEKQSLVDMANVARQRAYAPYSNYPVGSSLRTKTGKVYTGVNVENAAYPQTMCAERIAIFNEGGGFVFNAIHNIQGPTPVENMLALSRALRHSAGGAMA